MRMKKDFTKSPTLTATFYHKNNPSKKAQEKAKKL